MPSKPKKRKRPVRTDELFRGTCKHCGVDSLLYVQGEGKTRLMLYCADCDRGCYVERPGTLTGKRHHQPMKFTEEQTVEFNRLYHGEGLTLDQVAARYDTSRSTIARHLRLFGYKVLTREESGARDRVLRARQIQLQRHQERRKQFFGLLDEGYTHQAAAAMLGYSGHSLKLYKDWLAQKSECAAA